MLAGWIQGLFGAPDGPDCYVLMMPWAQSNQGQLQISETFQVVKVGSLIGQVTDAMAEGEGNLFSGARMLEDLVSLTALSLEGWKQTATPESVTSV